MIPSEWLDLAARRFKARFERTPLTYDPELDLYLKWENRQMTGSFKIRGALNKVLSLGDWEQQRGLVTASAGNHGQGVALPGNWWVRRLWFLLRIMLYRPKWRPCAQLGRRGAPGSGRI